MLIPQVKKVIDSLDVTGISPERKSMLQPLIDFIQNKVANNEKIRLNFICTHNSRRSHLSQVWAQATAFHLGLKNLFSYSGGTEATSLFPMAAKVLEKSGFKIIPLSEGPNPVYSIKYADNEHPIIGFSKAYDHDFNPKSGFAAIMTCSHADENCPFIEGAEKRIPIAFEDPKKYDGTPEEAIHYNDRSLQIATEMFYVFNRINL